MLKTTKFTFIKVAASALTISLLSACSSNSSDKAVDLTSKGTFQPQAVVCDQMPASQKSTQTVTMSGTTVVNSGGSQNIATNSPNCGGNGGQNIGGGSNQVVIINGQNVVNGQPEPLLGQQTNSGAVNVPVDSGSVGCASNKAYVVYGL